LSASVPIDGGDQKAIFHRQAADKIEKNIIDVKINDEGEVFLTYMFDEDPKTTDMRVCCQKFSKNSICMLE